MACAYGEYERTYVKSFCRKLIRNPRKLPVTVSGIFSQSTITSGKLFLQSFPEVIRTVHFNFLIFRFLLKKNCSLSFETPLLPCWLSTMTANDDDFGVVLLLFSLQFPLIATLLCEARLRQFLPLSEKCRRDRRIPRCALLHPDGSPFRRLYLSGNDQSLITFTGLDHRTFSYLLHKFSSLYNLYSPYSVNGKINVLRNAGARGGRPRS